MTDTAPRIPVIDIPDDPYSSMGILVCETTAGAIQLPLASVDYKATVAECIAQVTVTQTFKNPHDEPIEAVYCFPLAGSACVSNFEMKVGKRVITGRVDERKAARQAYDRAIEQGKRTALMEQERDGVFTVSVGNLPPGEEITVIITYSEKLPFFEDGQTELRLPLVIAERYIPGEMTEKDQTGEGVELDTDIVPDASRISPPRLAPGLDPNVSLDINVEITGRAEDDGFLEIEEISCSQYATKTSLKDGAIKIALSRDSERMNRDFVLRWTLAGRSIDSRFLLYTDEEGTRFGMVSVCPPKQSGYLGMPRDVVFVIDRSGSMHGLNMASASKACSILLHTLGPADRFAIAAFDNVVEWYDKGRFAKADESGICKGDRYLRTIDARGGTEMLSAVDDALAKIKKANSKTDRAAIIVLITDGQIGDEHRVLKRIQNDLGDTRIFTVGVDTAVNEGFLRRLANVGGGTSSFVEPGQQLEEALTAVSREIGEPLVTGISIDANGYNLEEDSVTPSPIPDLFTGRTSTLFFRLKGKSKKSPRLTVTGTRADGKRFTEIVKSSMISLPAVAQLWAKSRVSDLEDIFRTEDSLVKNSVRKEIIEVAVKHSLLTRFTAFVVVDESEVVNKDGTARKVVQPVEMPERWGVDTLGSVFGAQLGAVPTGAAPAPPADTGSWGGPPEPAQPADTGGWGAATPAQEAGGGSWGDALSGTMGGDGSSGRLYGSIAAGGLGGIHRARKQHPLAEERDSKDDLKYLVDTFQKFARELLDVISKLKGGCVPPYQPLETARTVLLSLLAKLNISSKLPGLQSFLRSDVRALIHAISSPGIIPEALETYAVNAEVRLKEVEKEMKLTLAGKKSSGDNSSAFWEISI